MKLGWIGGWGVSLEEMKAIALAHAPDAEHLIYPPVVGAAENLVGCDAVIGWSFGAHLLLEAAARGGPPAGPPGARPAPRHHGRRRLDAGTGRLTGASTGDR